MAVKKSEDQFRVLLVETILAMCRNTLNYDSEVSVEGLIGITLDKEEIFLVTINQLISNPDAVSSTGKRKRKRKRKQKKAQESNSEENDSDNQSGTEEESNKRSRKQSDQSDHSSRQDKSDDKDNNKSSKSDRKGSRSKNGEGNDDLVFLKEEPGASSSGPDPQSSYSFPHVSEALSSSNQSGNQLRTSSSSHSSDIAQRDNQYLSPGVSRPDHPVAGTSQGFTSPSKQSVPLWEFLLEMLCNPQCNDVVSWTGNGWEFRISQPGELARIWGEYKGFPKMSYDSLSRSLRQYYQRDIIRKTRGKMYVYYFTDSVAEKKFNMAPEEMFGAYNVWPAHLMASQQPSINDLNLPWRFPEGATSQQYFSQEGSTSSMMSHKTGFKRNKNRPIKLKSSEMAADESLLIDLSSAMCYPSELNKIKEEDFSNSDDSLDTS